MDLALCPFCNAVLPSLSSRPAAERLPCPRCGELVPAGRWKVDPSAQADLGGSRAAATAPVTLGNRKTAFIVLGIMLTMAVIGLSYTLWTTQLRQARHPWMPKKEEPIARRRPLELSGLGYLPKGSQFIAALHVAEMMEDKTAGSALLDEPRPPLVDWILKHVLRTTGLPLERLDHLLVAATLDVHFPQLVVVVKTRIDYDLRDVAKVAKPTRPALHEEKPLYEYAPDAFLAAFIWCIDDRTLIYLFRQDAPDIKHLSGLSSRPRPIAEIVPAKLRETVGERLPTHQYAWAVGQPDQLGPMREFMPASVKAIKDVKTFVLGVEPVEGLTLSGHFQVTDAKTAAGLKGFLESVKIQGGNAPKVETTPADATDQWVIWQLRAEAAALREFLSPGKERKK